MSHLRAAVALAVVAALSAAPAVFSAAEPLPTAFTYQGALHFQGRPLRGSADFQFALHDASAGGTQTGSTLPIDALPIVDGLFTVALDFGVDVFNGEARYLEIAVRSPAGRGVFTTLAPRTAVSATPYALQTRGIFVNDAGEISIGGAGEKAVTSGANPAQLRVTTTVPGAVAIHGRTNAPAGPAEGVKGTSASPEGRGVVGRVTTVTGDTIGVLGISDSPTGEGVRGEGATGVCGTSGKASGKAVLGVATGGDVAIGVSGMSTSPAGEGVRGEGATGVCGSSTLPGGSGVLGLAGADGTGVVGQNLSAGGEGVLGVGPTGICGEGIGGGSVGVEGVGAADGSAGMLGRIESRSSLAAGVVGCGFGATGPGAPAAAAFDVRNGAILVSGDHRPAGTIEVTGGTQMAVTDTGGDVIGSFILVDLVNDLLVPDSIILVTFEKTGSPGTSVAFSTDIFENKKVGVARVRIMRHGGGVNFNGKLHYLVINPSTR